MYLSNKIIKYDLNHSYELYDIRGFLKTTDLNNITSLSCQVSLDNKSIGYIFKTQEKESVSNDILSPILQDIIMKLKELGYEF